MEVNGEAIYGSRLWEHYADGETIRYTSANGYVYAVSLQWPGRQLTLHQVRPEAGSEIHLLGYDRPLEWSFDAGDGLTIMLLDGLQDESSRPTKYAYSFRTDGNPIEGGGRP